MEFMGIVWFSAAGRFGCWDCSSAIDAAIGTPRWYAASIAAWACGGLEIAPRASRTTSAPESRPKITPAAKRPPSAMNLNIGTLVGSYETVARLMDEIAEVEGASGVLLTFDDFLVGLDQFGQRIQPLMKTRANVQAG